MSELDEMKQRAPIELVGVTHSNNDTQDETDPLKFYKGSDTVSLRLKLGATVITVHVDPTDVFRALDVLDGVERSSYRLPVR